MYRTKTIILRPCKENKSLMDEYREVPVNYKLRERMRMSNHPMNVWVKTGPNTECNHYLQKCRPLNRIKTLPMLMRRSMRRRSMKKSMRRSMRRRSMKKSIRRSMRRRSMKRRKKSLTLKLSPSLIKSVNKAIYSRRRTSRRYYKKLASSSRSVKKSKYRRRSYKRKSTSRRRKSNCVEYN